jgi:hypothetical protein
MKKQNKWLDNYGKVDNANESSVSFSENFVGEGYDTEGRNYSPAWGGQFQTGGSIPGTTGFTYARMTDSNNVKDKNSNKIIHSAQKGITSPSYKKGITNEILRRQAYKESTFNPKAVSPKGYKGLTQIGEDVIKDYMKKKENKKLDPFNPKDAVELQRFAMDDLYNSSFINKPNQSDSVRIAKTLTAYNWGRGNLFNYLGEQKKKGVDIYNSYEWLNNLPKETSDYVNKIFLQKDSSFNENYKKASANPKYKSINSLYDIKKFGGEIPSAQNGQEMKFYQEGLDWKPKSMQDGGQQPLEVSTSDPRYADLYKNRQLGRWINENEFDSQVPLDEVVVTGKDERVKEYMSRYSDSFLRNALGVMGSPQTGSMELITGKQQTPSEAWGFQEPGGWLDSYSSFGKNLSNFAMDATLDPLNLLGVGLVDDLSKGAVREIAQENISKSIKNSITPYGYSFENIIDIPKNVANYYKGEPKVFPSKIQKLMNSNPHIRNLINETSTNREDAFSVYLGLKPENKNLKLIGTDDATQLSKYELLNPKYINKSEINDYITSLNYGKINSNLKKLNINDPGSNVIDSDRIFGVMGGYSKSVTPDGKSLMYRDVWDLQPFKSQKYLPEFIRNFEVSSIVPGANPFVSEGKLADIKTKYSKPYYKSITNEIDDRLSYPGVSDYLYDIADEEGIEFAKKEYDKIRKNIIKDLISEKSKGQKISGYYSNKDQKYLDVSKYINIKKKKQGGVIKDDRGQWDHPGEITEINSNYITMKPDPLTGKSIEYPMIGQSNTGDTKLMFPGKNYKFKGKKVTEYPILKNGGRTGINDLDAQPMKKLNQLLNFTNDPDNTNWLDKYN